jgi:hypothetical protein
MEHPPSSLPVSHVVVRAANAASELKVQTRCDASGPLMHAVLYDPREAECGRTNSLAALIFSAHGLGVNTTWKTVALPVVGGRMHARPFGLDLLVSRGAESEPFLVLHAAAPDAQSAGVVRDKLGRAFELWNALVEGGSEGSVPWCT